MSGDGCRLDCLRLVLLAAVIVAAVVAGVVDRAVRLELFVRGRRVAALEASGTELREELAATRSVIGIFYDAGRADALGIRRPGRYRVSASGHLALVRDQSGKGA